MGRRSGFVEGLSMPSLACPGLSAGRRRKRRRRRRRRRLEPVIDVEVDPGHCTLGWHQVAGGLISPTLKTFLLPVAHPSLVNRVPL